MTRWRLLTTFLIGLAAQPALAGQPRRPNVLWICADDFAPYVYGAYGNRQVRTPHLDRLALEGLCCERAYCNSPVCTASRQSFLTGRYPRTVGVTQLASVLPEGETTLADMLGAAGYDCAAIGKMHFNSPLTHGFDLRLDTADQGRWLKARGPRPLPSGGGVQPPWRPFRDPARVWLNSACLPVAAVDADMAGTWFARQAADYLQAKRDRPFFLMVSFYEPHSPFVFPVEYRDRHRAEEFTAPRVGPQDDWQVPAIFRDLSDAEKQGIIAAYYTSVEFMDKNAGIVLDALRNSGRERDTLVILTGDHGYMLGQHGRFEKHCCYEPAIRAPLVFRLPGTIEAGSRTGALVEFIDIVPTVLELCGVTVPAMVQGRSMGPLVRDETDAHRDHVTIEYSENEEAAIRTERWKFIYTTGKRLRQDGYAMAQPLAGRKIQLFDVVSDPDELHNLADEPNQAERLAQLTAQLAEHLRRTARQPELLPQTDDLHDLVDFALQPHDVPPPGR